MKIFWYEIRKTADASIKWLSYSGANFGNMGLIPDTTFSLFFSMYRKCSDLRRVVNEIMQTTAKKGYQVTDGDWVVEDTAILEYLEYEGGFQALKKNIIRDLCVAGSCYLLKLKGSWTGKPLWLQRLDPRTMTVFVNEYGEVLKYEQRARGKVKEYKADEIKHCYQELDPDNEATGLSPLEGLITDVLADTEAGLTNYYFFKNSAVPWHLVVLDEGMTQEEQNNAVKQLKTMFGGGWKNKHKLGAISWIKDIKKLQESMADMQYEVLRRFTTERVCAGYGVPKIILGYTDGVNYTNAETQYKKYIENTILPREVEIANWLNEIIAEEKISKAWNSIKILSDHIDNYISAVDTVIKQMQYWLITVNEAREELGYEQFVWMEEADKPLISKSLDLLSDVWLSDITPINGNT